MAKAAAFIIPIIVVVILAVVVGAIFVLKSSARSYTWLPGVDATYVGDESNTIEISPFVDEETTKKRCDELKTEDGKRCLAAVLYGDNVYYRSSLLEEPRSWEGQSLNPARDGSWVVAE